MTFVGLLLRFFLGYACGLLTGPLVGGYYSKPGDVSIRGGIAGGLGSAGPYIFLNSIWAQEWTKGKVLTTHTVWVSIFICILSVAMVEWFGRRWRTVEQPDSVSANPDAVPPATGRSRRMRKSENWLWLCVPALAYSLWGRFAGRPVFDRWVLYLIGLLAFLGFGGLLVSSTLSSLRTNKK
jgi:hypothetical protein